MAIPRTRGIDPIDWIEQIPYSETRNYVQRVIENTEVYRERLAGRGERLRILADLYRPNPPPRRPVLRGPAEPAPAHLPVPQMRPEHASAAGATDGAAPHTETAALDRARPAQPSARPADGRNRTRPAGAADAVIVPKEKPGPLSRRAEKPISAGSLSHSRARRCASAICPELISAEIWARQLFASSLPFIAARLNHLCAAT